MADGLLSNDKSPVSKSEVKAQQVVGSPTNYVITIGIDTYLSNDFIDFGYCCKRDGEEFIAAIKNYQDVHCEELLYNEFATKEAILKKLNDFLNDKESKNTPNNSLIFFYSGHGHLIEDTGGNRGMLIPHDTKDIELALGFDELIILFKRLKTKNFLFILDSCNSGSLFDENRKMITTIPVAGQIERSCWGIASSHSNEKSKVLENGKHSVFSNELIKILNNDLEEILKIPSLNDLLDKAFGDGGCQQFFSERLNIGQENNSGIYHLKCNEDEHRSRMIKKLLTDELPKLNYTDQRLDFAEFDYSEKKQIFIFRGLAESGLELLGKYATTAPTFPRNCLFKKKIDLPSISPGNTDLMVWLFGSALEKDFSGLDELVEFLNRRLLVEPMLLEFRFPPPTNSSVEDEISKKQKDEFLYQLCLLLGRISSDQKMSKLMIFLFDFQDFEFENTDYLTRTAKILDPQVRVVHTKSIKALSIRDAYAWYNQLNGYQNKSEEEKDRFQHLFDGGVKVELLKIIEQGGICFPPAVIKALCEVNNCPSVAIELLYNK